MEHTSLFKFAALKFEFNDRKSMYITSTMVTGNLCQGNIMAMRVLQVLPDLKKQGGVEHGVLAWVNQHPDILYVASAGGALTERIKHHITLPLATKNPLHMLRNAGHLERVIHEYNISLVHVRSRAPAWSVMLACRRAGIPWLATYHGLYNAHNCVKKYYNSIMTRGKTVIAISDWVTQHIQTQYPQAHITTIHEGVNTAHFCPPIDDTWRTTWRSEWDIADDQKVVLLPGRLTRWKGQHVLLEAARGLNASWVVILLGDEQQIQYAEELKRTAQNLPVRVIMLPGCSDMRLPYAGADVVVSCSTDPEAFGRVTAEALAMERPYIGTNHGGTVELTQHGKFGCLVPPGNALALREALLSGRYLSQGASIHIQKHYNETVMHEQTFHVYEKLC